MEKKEENFLFILLRIPFPYLEINISVSTCFNLGDIKVSGRQTPIITGRQLQFPNATTKEPRQAWLETLETIEDEKLGIVDLHPQVFGALPR